jgi:hypothetical protein
LALKNKEVDTMNKLLLFLLLAITPTLLPQSVMHATNANFLVRQYYALVRDVGHIKQCYWGKTACSAAQQAQARTALKGVALKSAAIIGGLAALAGGGVALYRWRKNKQREARLRHAEYMAALNYFDTD